MENSIRGDYRPCILQATSSMAEDYVLLYLRIPREFIRLSSPPAYVMSNQTTRRIFLTGFGSVLVAGEAVGSVSAQRGGNPNQSIRIVQPTDDILKEGETYTARAVFQGGKAPDDFQLGLEHPRGRDWLETENDGNTISSEFQAPRSGQGISILGFSGKAGVVGSKDFDVKF